MVRVLLFWVIRKRKLTTIVPRSMDQYYHRIPVVLLYLGCEELIFFPSVSRNNGIYIRGAYLYALRKSMSLFLTSNLSIPVRIM